MVNKNRIVRPVNINTHVWNTLLITHTGHHWTTHTHAKIQCEMFKTCITVDLVVFFIYQSVSQSWLLLYVRMTEICNYICDASSSSFLLCVKVKCTCGWGVMEYYYIRLGTRRFFCLDHVEHTFRVFFR